MSQGCAALGYMTRRHVAELGPVPGHIVWSFYITQVATVVLL